MPTNNFLALKHKFNFRKPWLVLGKGPSFSKIWELDSLPNYNLLGINHVAKLIRVDITNIIDFEVLEYHPDVFHQSTFLTMPWHPHRDHHSDWPTLDQLLLNWPVNKIFWYNLSTWKNGHRSPENPVLRAEFFSAEAVFEMLGYLGANEIHTLGIDGGGEYAEEFLDIGLKPLRNLRDTFDDQFEHLADTVKRFGMKYRKL